SSDANGFVLAEGLLHRDAGQWWHWTDPTDRPWTDVAWLARSAGACIGDQGDLWLAEADGAVWRITGDLATRVEPFDGADRAALVDGLGAAVVLDGDVLVGDAETIVHYTFEAGSASEVSSGGQALWIAAGGRLLRLADGEFMTATQDDAPVEPGEPVRPVELAPCRASTSRWRRPDPRPDPRPDRAGSTEQARPR
ncbi:MAG: hypothetical protein KDK70_37135, partial [Myxococcales bacterium]|nr:hypothetical protein [Myxococcales bacterium]